MVLPVYVLRAAVAVQDATIWYGHLITFTCDDGGYCNIYTDKCCVYFGLGADRASKRRVRFIRKLGLSVYKITSRTSRSGALHFRRPEKYVTHTFIHSRREVCRYGDNFQSQPCISVLRHVAEKQSEAKRSSSNRTLDRVYIGCKTFGRKRQPAQNLMTSRVLSSAVSTRRTQQTISME